MCVVLRRWISFIPFLLQFFPPFASLFPSVVHLALLTINTAHTRQQRGWRRGPPYEREGEGLEAKEGGI